MVAADESLSPGTTYTINVCLEDYSDVCLSKSFKVIILPCEITNYEITSGSISNIDYYPWNTQ